MYGAFFYPRLPAVLAKPRYIVSSSGAGVFDGLFLTGIVALLLATR